MIKNAHYLYGILGIFVGALALNIILGNNFHISFAQQPVAHSNHLFNFIGMMVVGLIAVLIGGCPIRQIPVLASEGDSGCRCYCNGYYFWSSYCSQLLNGSFGEGVQ